MPNTAIHARDQYEWSITLFELGDITGALAAVSTAITLDPTIDEYHCRRAEYMTASGQYEAVLRYSDSVIASNPNTAIYQAKASAYLRLRNFPLALDVYQTMFLTRSLESYGTDCEFAQICLLASLIASCAHRPETAVELSDLALSCCPNVQDLHMLHGQIAALLAVRTTALPTPFFGPQTPY
jgi:tetratricopeptide (TPR) repeat protein